MAPCLANRLTFSNLTYLHFVVGLVLADTNIASWEGLRGTQIQSKIILEGGIMTNGTYNNGRWSDTSIVQHSYGVYYQIDLTKSFDINKQDITDYMVPGQQETSNTLAPSYIAGGIFSNDYQFYTFGGLADKSPIGLSSVLLGMVFPSNPSVTRFDQGVSPNQPTDGISDNITSGAYVSIPDQGLGFYFSGMVSATGATLEYSSNDAGNNHPTVPAQTFVKIDMTEPNHARFQNMSWPSGLSARSEGALVWLPYGAKGVLVAIGGVEIPGDRFIVPPRTTADGPFMTELAIYDIDADVWHIQETLEEGERPTQLASFCTVVVPTQDKSSYEIFVYGGYDGTYTSVEPYVRDDVWVLSVPAFQWTKVLSAGRNSTHGRQGSVCFAPNPSSMVSVGGTGQLGSSLTSDTIVDILDLNSLNWTGSFDASSTTPFIVPRAVVDQLKWPADGKGPGSGVKATLLNGTLDDLFSNPYTGEIKTYYPYSSDRGSDEPQNPIHWKVAVIATLCTVIPLVIIGLVIVFWLSKRRKDKQGIQRTQLRRNKVFSWLGKVSAIDPAPPKSLTSGLTGNTLMDEHPDYLRQHGYSNKNGQIYEAESPAAPVEIMDHPPSDQSHPSNNLQVPNVQQSTLSYHNGSTTPSPSTFTIPRKPTRVSQQALTFELPSSTDQKGTTQSSDVDHVTNNSNCRSSIGDNVNSDVLSTNVSSLINGQSFSGDEAQYRPLAGHSRNISSMSSGLPGLASTEQAPDDPDSDANPSSRRVSVLLEGTTAAP